MANLDKGQYTVRIYEENIASKVDETYEKMISLFPSKNAFITRCVELGIDELRNQYGIKTSYSTLSQVEKLDAITKELKVVSTALKEKVIQDSIQSEIEQKNSSCLYHMILNLSKGTPLTAKEIESGLYDFMPERFKEEMLELMDKFK